MCNEQLKADAHTNLRDINCLIGAVDDSVSELTKKLAQLRIEREGLVQRKNQNLLALELLEETLTLHEAFYEASRHKECIKHTAFGEDEYIYYDTDLKQWFTEDGHSIDVNTNYKKNPFFEKGWSIVEMTAPLIIIDGEVIEIPI